MTSPEDIERRLKAAASDAAAARVLAAGADRDCAEMKAELRSHTTVLNAVRETQVEQGKTLAGHGQTLAGHSQAIARLEKTMNEGFAKTEQQFAKVGQGMAHIVGLLESRRPHRLSNPTHPTGNPREWLEVF